jgi:hypothetical protein
MCVYTIFTIFIYHTHRWTLSPISVMSDIGLSLYRTVRYWAEREKICRTFRYRTKVFSDIRYPTSKLLKPYCTRCIRKQAEMNFILRLLHRSFHYLTTNFLSLMKSKSYSGLKIFVCTVQQGGPLCK